ncbi:hypothetical protein OEZ86_012635 [Tetradesmus obliquus]|nr:hypothetical protein OEZ86_012635 [Tetradesmus obliquus]
MLQSESLTYQLQQQQQFELAGAAGRCPQQQQQQQQQQRLVLPGSFYAELQQLPAPDGALLQQLQQDVAQIECLLAELGSTLAEQQQQQQLQASPSCSVDPTEGSRIIEQQQQQQQDLSSAPAGLHAARALTAAAAAVASASGGRAAAASGGRARRKPKHRVSQRSGGCAAVAAGSGGWRAGSGGLQAGRSARPSLDGAMDAVFTRMSVAADSQQEALKAAAAAGATQCTLQAQVQQEQVQQLQQQHQREERQQDTIVDLLPDDVAPLSHQLIGMHIEVMWPKDSEWYSGSVTGYNPDTQLFIVDYSDGEAEDNRAQLQHIGAAWSAKVHPRYVRCVVANAAADGRITYRWSPTMLKALLLGLPLVQHSWLVESLAAGQLLPVEGRHLIKGCVGVAGAHLDGGPARAFAAAQQGLQQHSRLFEGLGVACVAVNPTAAKPDTPLQQSQIIASIAKLGGAVYVLR